MRWSGEPFSFAGKHYRIDKAQFLPRPVQRPRIPVWVAGMLPAKAPFRRAARWDGAFPIYSDEHGFTPLTPADVRETRAYVQQHRTSDAAFDVIVGRDLPDDPGRARDEVAEFREAGMTWWMASAFGADDLRGILRTPLPPS